MAFCVLSAWPQTADANETLRPVRQHMPGDCEGGGFTVSSAWNLYVPDNSPGADSEAVAQLLSTGTFLMGCEDEYPRPTTGITAPATSECFGSLVCATDKATGLPPTVSLATYGELGADALSPTTGLSKFYSFPNGWFDAVDDPEDEQNYFIAYVEANPASGVFPKVLIVGASRDGLHYGVIDWLKSLERVEFAGATVGNVWSPDPVAAASLGLPNQCQLYGTAGCARGTSGPGPKDVACWGAGAWDAVNEIEWCPEAAVNYPDVPKRLGFPGFAGGEATFLPRVLAKQWPSDCDATASPPFTETDWWNTLLSCDRNGFVGTSSNGPLCQAARLRLDALVWGKFTHAIDESYALWQSDRLAYDTKCDSAQLYEQAWEYLRQRRVILVPSAFGMEARSQEEPVGGRLKDDATAWHASQWGKYGNFKHSEGLSIDQREFEVCSTSFGDFLAPTPEPLSPDGSLDACVDYLDSYNGAAVATPQRAALTHSFEGAGLNPPTAQGFALSDPGGCWGRGSPGHSGQRAEPSADNCDLTITLPLDPTTENRLYAVTFQARVAKDAGDLKALEGILRVVDTTGTVVERGDMTFKKTLTDTTGYHETTPSADPDHDWVNFSIVLRIPPADPDGDGVDDITAMTLDLVGGHDGTDPLVWLDDLRILELDGMLRNVDADSVRFFDEVGDELDPSCFEILEDAYGLTSTSSPPTGVVLPSHFEDDPSSNQEWLGWHALLDSAGDVTDYRASIQVLTDPCPRLDGSGNWVGTHPVFLTYRSWTHAGLWPKPASTQEHYVYSPNIFQNQYWLDRWSPTQQMRSLADDLGHKHKPMSDPDKADEFILVSDLGGEIRGLNRASATEADVTNAEKFASYYCQLRAGVCTAYDDFTCSYASNCSSMWGDPTDPSWAPCDCSSWTGVNGPDLLIAADMFALGHNGAQEFYQVPYGGFAGNTMDALQYMPPDTTFLAWWHFDSKKAGSDVIGQEMAAGLVYELGLWDFDTIGAPARDPDNQRMWAAMAAAGARSDDPFVKGVAHYGWGTDAEGSQYMAQTGQYSWQPEWQLLQHWFLSSNPGNPGGDDRTQWWASDMGLTDDGVVRPNFGQRLVANSGYPDWGTASAVPLDTDQLQPPWSLLWPSGDWQPDWAPWAQVLLRSYVTIPAQCDIEVEFEFDGDYATAPVITSATVTPAPSSFAGATDTRVVSARAPVPQMTFTDPFLDGLEVDVHVRFNDCDAATLDSPALYQGLSFIDFPYPYIELSIDVEWTSTDSNDSTATACKGLPSPCVHTRTFDAR